MLLIFIVCFLLLTLAKAQLRMRQWDDLQSNNHDPIAFRDQDPYQTVREARVSLWAKVLHQSYRKSSF